MIPILSKRSFALPSHTIIHGKNSNLVHDSDLSDLIQKDLFTSNGNSEVDDKFFDDDPLSNDDVEKSIVFDNETYKSSEIVDNLYHRSLTKYDSENLIYKTRS